jgi:hypothetical protein
MSDIKKLLSQFQTNANKPSPNVWGETQESLPTPEDEDGDRLEQSIREVFSSKKLLNKALATFLGVFAASGGVGLMTSLGIGAMATGTIGSIVLGLFFANTLTKIQYDGQIHIDQQFIVAAAQTVSIGGALWIAFDEYRAVSHASKAGKERFYQEIKEYEIKPPPPTGTPWLTIGGMVLAFLVVLAIAGKG